MTTATRKPQSHSIGKRLKRRRSFPQSKSIHPDFYLSPEYEGVPQIPDEFFTLLKNGRPLSESEDRECTDVIRQAALELRKRMERLNRTGEYRNELGLAVGS